jgi:uncharacterized damage-inducible protein DinB
MTNQDTTHELSEAHAGTLAAAALDEHLAQLTELLDRMPASRYADPSIDHCFGSTIGGHFRHVLDHVRNLLACEGAIDYEARQRGSEIERSPYAARTAISESRRALASRLIGTGERVTVSTLVLQSKTSLRAESTFERELMYVVDHTVHHLAMVRMMLARVGVDCPAEVGVASGTPMEARCAR